MGLRGFLFSAARGGLNLVAGRGLGNLRLARAAYSLFFTFVRAIVEINGYKMYINPHDMVVSKKLVFNNEWEPFETEIFKKEIKSGGVVLDIGANIGYYTLLAAKLVGPTGKVYAFEPETANYALLQKNVQANGFANVILEQKAVSKKGGKLKLYLSEQNKGDHRIYSGEDARPAREVDTVSLDDYFEGYSGKIDFIKMDIQGAEALALEGMQTLLKKNPRITLVTEFFPDGLQKCGTEPAGYLARLLELGFKISKIDESKAEVTPVAAAGLLTTAEPETNLLCRKE